MALALRLILAPDPDTKIHRGQVPYIKWHRGYTEGNLGRVTYSG